MSKLAIRRAQQLLQPSNRKLRRLKYPEQRRTGRKGEMIRERREEGILRRRERTKRPSYNRRLLRLLIIL
jgi:hypothetical protein